MPSVNAGELETCLLVKLRAVERPGKHRKFEIFDDQGNLVARTLLSRSWRSTTPISSGMVGNIKNQLRLASASNLLDLIDCTLTRESYLELVQ